MTVALAGGGYESLSDVQAYQSGVPVPGTFVFSGTVASLVTVEYEPSG